MQSIEILKKIRGHWLARVSHSLVRGEGVRASFEEQLARFYELLEQAVASGDPSWLDQLLDDWAEARTETELERGETSLFPLLNQILLLTFDVLREYLTQAESMELLGSILPIYTYAFERVVNRETELQIYYVSNDLEKVRDSLERLDRSKSDFISVAAHELKTPLTLIEGYAAMLREYLPTSRDVPKTELLLQGIDKGTHRLHEIIDDMIDVSMIDNQMLDLNYQPMRLSQLLALTETDLSESVRDRNQSLHINEFTGFDELIFCDSERMFQALRNVVSNAIKYTPDGGAIEIDGRKLPGFIELTVSDTGIGIDNEDQLTIFEKFSRIGNAQLHSSGKTKFKGGGPGLGLPIARGIIEAHGGTIWVESPGFDEVNCPGSTFHLLIPLLKEPPDDKSAVLYRAISENEQRKTLHTQPLANLNE